MKAHFDISGTIYHWYQPSSRITKENGRFFRNERLPNNACARCANVFTTWLIFAENDLVQCGVSGKWISPLRCGMVCFKRKTFDMKSTGELLLN